MAQHPTRPGSSHATPASEAAAQRARDRETAHSESGEGNEAHERQANLASGRTGDVEDLQKDQGRQDQSEHHDNPSNLPLGNAETTAAAERGRSSTTAAGAQLKNNALNRGAVRGPVNDAMERARERAAIDGGILLSAAEDKANARPPAGTRIADLNQADEIAALKAQIAALADLIGGTPTTGDTVSAQAVANIIQPVHDITVGGTVRPEFGPLHLTAGTPLFNANRPTGRHG